MAEAIGVAASIATFVEISIKVASLCMDYAKKVKNADDDIRRLRTKIEGIATLAEDIQEQIKNSVQKRLDPSTRRKFMSSIGLRLKWSFESKDVDKIILDLEKCKTDISLALQLDTTEVKTGVRTLHSNYHLAFTKVTDIISYVRKAIDEEPEIAAKTLEKQFDFLIFQPLTNLDQGLSNSVPMLVLLIDALDECEGVRDIKTILRLLAKERKGCLVPGPGRLDNQRNPTSNLPRCSSVLIFSPQKSSVRVTFQSCISKWIRRLPETPESWDAELQKLEIHRGLNAKVIFGREASISVRERKIISLAYNCTTTGEQLRTLDPWSPSTKPALKL
ncbi:hypothetical protein TWF703_000040 [Orbilia oligospora]|uniref:Fungal N-terminal domain-containing protein n=1 Tax=Orbilia oligospora TaxID=2813651 RepID=A0A7C8PDW5_ORBOL|nr:hypothetical protein TWF703_000040 [Orbilia oligospora]